jgi:hypothetical protein
LGIAASRFAHEYFLLWYIVANRLKETKFASSHYLQTLRSKMSYPLLTSRLRHMICEKEAEHELSSMSQYQTIQNQGHSVFPKSPLPGQEESEERCIAERYLARIIHES